MSDFKIIPNGLLAKKPQLGKVLITGTPGSLRDCDQAWFNKMWDVVKEPRDTGGIRMFTGQRGMEAFHRAVIAYTQEIA